ncbi:hypothetical protein L1Q43_10145, partial [Klebsiella pneumoniae]
VFAGKKSAQIREILISESAWEEMTCLFAPSLSQLILVCEQMRDYSGAAAYLKAALRVAPLDNSMKEKKELYAKLGVI